MKMSQRLGFGFIGPKVRPIAHIAFIVTLAFGLVACSTADPPHPLPSPGQTLSLNTPDANWSTAPTSTPGSTVSPNDSDQAQSEARAAPSTTSAPPVSETSPNSGSREALPLQAVAEPPAPPSARLSALVALWNASEIASDVEGLRTTSTLIPDAVASDCVGPLSVERSDRLYQLYAQATDASKKSATLSAEEIVSIWSPYVSYVKESCGVQ